MRDAPDRYAVIGYPVRHSLSPFIHAMFAKQTAQNIAYGKLEIAPEKLAADVNKFFDEGGQGLNVTIPHKQAVVALCKFRTARAERAGAVNTLAVRENGLLGDNTDGAGLVRDLTANLEFSLRGKRILLLGAGGAARGVLAPLLEQRPTLVHIMNRTAEKAAALAQEFKDLGEVTGAGFDSGGRAPYDLIINATAASLQGEAPPIAASTVSSHTLCYDMAYGKEDTAFALWAKKHRARAELGWGMLVEQAAESFFLWRGTRPNTAPVLKTIKAPAP